jgi:hypothetical protein
VFSFCKIPIPLPYFRHISIFPRKSRKLSAPLLSPQITLRNQMITTMQLRWHKSTTWGRHWSVTRETIKLLITIIHPSHMLR